jgi:ribonucleoside-diphosphate reductase alpha chain
MRFRITQKICLDEEAMQATMTQNGFATPRALADSSPLVAPQTPQSAYTGYQIIRRNGAVVPFEPSKIAVAMMKAFLAVHGTQGAASASVREAVELLTQQVVRALLRSRPGGGTFHIEDVQDQVELGLMRGEHLEVARAYVLYRERRPWRLLKHPFCMWWMPGSACP